MELRAIFLEKRKKKPEISKYVFGFSSYQNTECYETDLFLYIFRGLKEEINECVYTSCLCNVVICCFMADFPSGGSCCQRLQKTPTPSIHNTLLTNHTKSL